MRYPDPRSPLDYLRVLALLPWWFFPVVALMIGGSFVTDAHGWFR